MQVEQTIVLGKRILGPIPDHPVLGSHLVAAVEIPKQHVREAIQPAAHEVQCHAAGQCGKLVLDVDLRIVAASSKISVRDSELEPCVFEHTVEFIASLQHIYSICTALLYHFAVQML